MNSITTHYDNLQVSRNASESVIRAAYRTLSQQHHPDKNPNNLDRAHRVMKIINEAYAVLSDPQRKASHDRWIQQEEIARDSAASSQPSPPPEKPIRPQPPEAKAQPQPQPESASASNEQARKSKSSAKDRPDPSPAYSRMNTPPPTSDNSGMSAATVLIYAVMFLFLMVGAYDAFKKKPDDAQALAPYGGLPVNSAEVNTSTSVDTYKKPVDNQALYEKSLHEIEGRYPEFDPSSTAYRSDYRERLLRDTMIFKNSMGLEPGLRYSINNYLNGWEKEPAQPVTKTLPRKKVVRRQTLE